MVEASGRYAQHWLDLNGCESLAALIKLEAHFGIRAFELLGYAVPADHPDHPDTPASPAGLHRVAGGWCRTSDKSAGTTGACKVGNRVCQGEVYDACGLSGHCSALHRAAWRGGQRVLRVAQVC